MFCVCRFPPPAFPPVNRFHKVAVDAIGISIVSFAINISMAKMFAKKHAYSLHSNQVDFVDDYDFYSYYFVVEFVEAVNLLQYS